MKDLKILGQKVRQDRLVEGMSQAKLAEKLNIDTTYLSKIENGHIQPTQKQIQAIINVLSLDQKSSVELWLLSGRPPGGIVTAQRANPSDLERIKNMANSTQKQVPKAQPVNFNIDPQKATLYSDVAAVVSSPNGMTLQFGQLVPGSNTVNIVSSVGVSFEHARQISDAIANELEKNER